MIDAAIWLPPKPAIIIPQEVHQLRLHVDNEDAGHDLPKDYLALPPALRWTVPVSEIIKGLPEPYRLLSDDLILAMLGGWPGPIMAGGIKSAWLYTANGTLTIPGDWNKLDNAIHGVGKGGNGVVGFPSDVFPGTYYGGAGGGGAAWAAIINRIYAVAQQLAVTVAVSSGDTSVESDLIAKSGSNASPLSGGVSNGGQGGQASACTGDQKNNGGDGFTMSGRSTERPGGHGGGAAGPHGDGQVGPLTTSGGPGDAGFGGEGGVPNDREAGDGIDGPGGGWNPNHPVNAGSGGGGYGGLSSPGALRNGGQGGRYGGAGGGGGAGDGGPPNLGTPGSGRQGCALAINNPSL